MPKHTWREKDDVIYSWVTSDGMSGKDWVPNFESAGFCVENRARKLLRSPFFIANKGMRYKIAVIRGILFENDDRFTDMIRGDATRRKFFVPPAEIACLVRKKFTDQHLKAMDLVRIITMHTPLTNADNTLFLSVCRGAGGRIIAADYASPKTGCWNPDDGFAFVVSSADSVHGE